MKSPHEIEQLNKQIGKDNEMNKVVIMLIVVLIGTIILFTLTLWGLYHHPVKTIISVAIGFLLAKFLSK